MKPPAAEKMPHFETRPLIEGLFTESRSSRRYADVNPANEETLAEACEGSEQDVDDAVKSARRAFVEERWSGLAPRARGTVLQRLAQLLMDHREELALIDCLDVGKPISLAGDEVEMACSALRFAAESCDKMMDAVLPSRPGLLAMNVREPVGVVGAILPWNFPMVVVALKIPPRSRAEQRGIEAVGAFLLSALRIGELALHAGIPPGVFNIVPGIGSIVGHAMATHDDIDLLTFTGSTSTGKALMRAAGQSNLKKLLLECGGKSPHIVFAGGGDLDVIADDVVEQITWNQGQVCVAGSRLLVQESIRADLVSRVCDRMAAIRPGDPMDPATTFGPLVSDSHLKKVMGYVEAAKSSGAKLKVGGRRLGRPGFFMEPTVFDEVGIDQTIAREEIFGPVLSVMPFKTVDEALLIAHSVSYGLSARIWTRDVGAGYALARKLRAGEVTVNATSSPSGQGAGAAASAEPFGQSGFGIEGGLAGMRQYTRCKSIQIHMPRKRFA